MIAEQHNETTGGMQNMSGTQRKKKLVALFRLWRKRMSRDKEQYRKIINYKTSMLERGLVERDSDVDRQHFTKRNPVIQKLLIDIEDDLRSLGILPEMKSKSSSESEESKEVKFSFENSDDMKKMKSELNKLRQENLELKALMLKSEQEQAGRLSEQAEVMQEIQEMVK